MAEILVCREGEMEEGDVRIVASGHREAGVFFQDGAYYAYRNLCPHQGGPACEGMIVPKVLAVIAEDQTAHGHTYDESQMHFVCPWHGYEYDMKTGVCAGDSSLRLQSCAISQRDGQVYVTL